MFDFVYIFSSSSFLSLEVTKVLLLPDLAHKFPEDTCVHQRMFFLKIHLIKLKLLQSTSQSLELFRYCVSLL